MGLGRCRRGLGAFWLLPGGLEVPSRSPWALFTCSRENRSLSHLLLLFCLSSLKNQRRFLGPSSKLQAHFNSDVFAL